MYVKFKAGVRLRGERGRAGVRWGRQRWVRSGAASEDRLLALALLVQAHEGLPSSLWEVGVPCGHSLSQQRHSAPCGAENLGPPELPLLSGSKAGPMCAKPVLPPSPWSRIPWESNHSVTVSLTAILRFPLKCHFSLSLDSEQFPHPGLRGLIRCS